MRSWILPVLVLVAGLCWAGGCGGGAGGGPVGSGGVTTADVGGTWLGPTGTATTAGALAGPAAAGGVMVDNAGMVTGSDSLAGLTGQLAVVDAVNGVLEFTGTGASTGINGIVMLAGDFVNKIFNHLLFAASDGTVSAMQRNAPMLQPLYMNAEFRGSTWAGTAVEVTPDFASEGTEPVNVTVDADGNFMTTDSMTNQAALAVFDEGTGEIRGDYADTEVPPELGNLLLLITPDRQFVAVTSCPTTAGTLTDCNWAALLRK